MVQCLGICLPQQEHSLELWSGQILWAMEQLGPCAMSAEAHAPYRAVLRSKRVVSTSCYYRKPVGSNKDPVKPQIKVIL